MIKIPKHINTTLKKFGLDSKEIKVYIACLKQGQMNPYQISKATGIARTTVYDVLMDLAFKGLVELNQSDGFSKQQTLVKAKNPSNLRKILQEKRKENLKLEVEISEILPELKQDFYTEEANANFQFYPGIDGFRKIHLSPDYDQPNIEILSWSQLAPHDDQGSDKMDESIEKILEKRESLTVPPKLLVPINDWTRHVITYQHERDERYLQNKEIRGIEGSHFECYVDLEIIGDYVKIATANNHEVWGLAIKSPSLALSMKSIFMLNWDRATPITKDVVESWGKNEYLKTQSQKL